MKVIAMGLIDRHNLNFLLYEWLRIEDRGQDRMIVDATLDLAERIAEMELLPQLRESDVNEPRLSAGGKVEIPAGVREALGSLRRSGIFGGPFAEPLGGAGLSQLVYYAALGILKSATIAIPSYVMLTVANARLIAIFGSAEQIETFARPQMAGDFFGTMCLSESHAGSSLADIRTRAVPDGSDRWGERYRLFGQKMWISGGDHDASENIIHLVLAKTVGDAGTADGSVAGISLYIVPKRLPDAALNDIVIAGLNHKMGYRGLPNCVMNFGEGKQQPGGAPGAVGWLVGQRGRGLSQMFQMMNEARIGVGLGSAAIALRAYQLSLNYSRARVQGRELGSKSGPSIAIACHPDVKRMLLAQKCYAEGSIALVLYAAHLSDEARCDTVDARQKQNSRRILELLTPVVKVWPSEWGQVVTDLAIQIHGGAGYTRDLTVEQLYRDQRLNQIHEGTTGIQALDLLGRKILADGGVSFGLLVERVKEDINAAAVFARLKLSLDVIAGGWDCLSLGTRKLIEAKRDVAALGNATTYLWAFGHCVVGWLWLDQARCLIDNEAKHDPAFINGKLRACRYFCETEMPKVDQWISFIGRFSDVVVGMQDAEF